MYSPPTGVSTSGVTSSGASVNWTAVTGATYDVRYRATGSSSWTTNAVSGIATTLSGLSATTQYEVQVRSKCASGNSSYSASVNFTTGAVQLNYCTSNGDSVADEYIQRVQLGSINNTSGAGSGGYQDHTSVSTSLAKSTSHTITITPRWTGTVYNEAYGVWIDYNKDGDFSDSGEQVWTKTASTTTPVSGSFTVPAGAATGATRMRVILRYNAVPTSCGNYNYGETEDYTVVIGAAQADTQAPTAPTSLAASSITQTTATLNWSASSDNVGVTSYEVFRGATSIGTVTGTSRSLSGLTPNTSYTYSVRARDAAGNVSSASNSVTFTTLSNVVTYCTSSGSRVTYEWIDYVSFGGMTNTSGANAGYGDFTTRVANVSRGSTNQIAFSAGFSGSSYTEYWSVWIDYNQDGDFNDSGEQIATGSSSSAGNLTANITIPTSASTGQTRMRVSMKYNSAPTSCENFGDGEVEDYTVNITNSVANYTTFNDPISGDVLGNEGNIFDFTMYPNPVKGSSLTVRVADARETSFTIKNMLGQTVKTGELATELLM